MTALLTFFSFVPFYLIGSIPTGYLIAKRKGYNIYNEGSGNVGATNVARVVGKKAGLETLLLDILKGFLPAMLAYLLTSDPITTPLYGAAVVAGHCFSIPGKLKGGKGVATALGVFLYLHYPSAMFGLAVFIVMVSGFRIVSLASVSAALVIPIFALFTNVFDSTALAMSIISLIVIFRHRGNLIRLTEGREKKISFGSGQIK